MQADSMQAVDNDTLQLARNSGHNSALAREGDLGEGNTREMKITRALDLAADYAVDLIKGYIAGAKDEHRSEARKNRDSLAAIVFPKQPTVAIQINMGSLMSELADKMTRQ